MIKYSKKKKKSPGLHSSTDNAEDRGKNNIGQIFPRIFGQSGS